MDDFSLFSEYASDDEGVKERIARFRSVDPYPEIPAALLSSEHIKAYVRQTAMVHKFDHQTRGKLKAASYEINPGKKFIYWDPSSKLKVVQPVGKDKPLILPANSITFAQLESDFALPDYIAVRFNLRIQHVHRGILLGTGPLIDPGFKGEMLIPLHNLTSDEYVIKPNEGLIWVEFTKTTHGAVKTPPGRKPITDTFNATEEPKKIRNVVTYFEKANRNNPIQSSLHSAVEEVRTKVKTAERAARLANAAVTTVTSVGFIAVLAAAIGTWSFFESIKNSHLTVSAQAIDANKAASDAKAETKVAASDAKRAIEDAKNSTDQVSSLVKKLDEANERIAKLERALSIITSTSGPSR